MIDRIKAILARLPDPSGGRCLIALAGPPGSGKSSLSAPLVAELTRRGRPAALVPMDGFHLDNRILNARGLLPRKGAPETFDAAGFLALITRLKHGEEVIAPCFDRDRDIAIAGAVEIPASTETAVVEGNYLLFDEAPWRSLAPLWDLSVFLDVPEKELRRRLVNRWKDHGLDDRAALERAEGNDLANARRILAARLPSTMTI